MTEQPIEVPGAEVVQRAPLQPSPTTPMREWSVIVAQAEILAQSDIVPGAYRNRPANIVAAAIAGRVHGWDAMTAMLNGHVIDGKYGVSPEAQLGLIRSRGHSVTKIAEDRGQSVTVRGVRGDTGDSLDVTWSMEDAKKAKLAGKQNWVTYPAPMLWARAVSELSTQLFSDVTLGLARYTAEEVDFSTDGTDDEQAIPARLSPPDGWGSWEECDAAHDAYIERWKLAPEDVRRKMTGYARSSGYERPMPKPALDELEAQLDIELGAPTERVATVKDSGAVEPTDALDEGASGEATAPETDSPAEPDDGGAPALSAADAASAGEPTEPVAVEGDEPDPEAEPDKLSDKGQHSRLAILVKQVWATPTDAVARKALIEVITQNRTGSSRQTTFAECQFAIRAAKLFASGELGFAVVVEENGAKRAEPLPVSGEGEPPPLPAEGETPTLIVTVPEGGSAEAGTAFVTELRDWLVAKAAA